MRELSRGNERKQAFSRVRLNRCSERPCVCLRDGPSASSNKDGPKSKRVPSADAAGVGPQPPPASGIAVGVGPQPLPASGITMSRWSTFDEQRWSSFGER